jgi:hypothetical protein
MSRRNENNANHVTGLAVVPRTLISPNPWMSPRHHKRQARYFADKFGTPVIIITKRGRRLAFAKPQ